MQTKNMDNIGLHFFFNFEVKALNKVSFSVLQHSISRWCAFVSFHFLFKYSLIKFEINLVSPIKSKQCALIIYEIESNFCLLQFQDLITIVSSYKLERSF